MNDARLVAEGKAILCCISSLRIIMGIIFTVGVVVGALTCLVILS
jgi:hypothetical protein